MSGLICIECREHFPDTEEGRLLVYKNCNRPVSKDSTVRVPLKKHVVFKESK